MIVFKKIEWKNLLSTGNEPQSVLLNQYNKTMIIGKNGHGKSTVIDAVAFALYGKPFRAIKKDNLINSVNRKDCLVTIHFSVGDKSYKIKRGVKPNIFEIYINDKMVDQDAKVRDYQKYLEDNILKMNYQTFTQVVVLGSTSYVPFMKLNSANRRDLVEGLLDIKVFSSMNILVKQNIKQVAEDYRELVGSIDILKEQIRLNIINRDSMKSRMDSSVSSNDKRRADNNLQIETIDRRIQDLEKVKLQLQNSIEDHSTVSETNKKYISLHGQLKNKLATTTSTIKFYNENTACPECDQDIEHEFKHNVLKKKTSLHEELSSGINRVKDTLDMTQRKLDNIRKINNDVVDIDSEIKSSRTHKSSLLKSNKVIDSDNQANNSDRDQITTLTADITNKKDILQKLEAKLLVNVEEKEYLSVMKQLISDEGVKASIMKKYIPLINKTINTFLGAMEFHARFELDEEFNETIYSRYVDKFSYANFSEGEKQRIDLALLFTWRKIAKMKNSGNTNLLIIDEIFDSSLDENGTEEFMKILYTLENENVFVISHKNHMAERFDDVIKFKKTGNFSVRV